MFWRTGDILVLCSLNRFVDRIWLLICVYLRERERACSLKVMFVQVSSRECAASVFTWSSQTVCGDQTSAALTVRRGEMKTQRPTALSPAPLGLLYFPLSLPSVYFSSELLNPCVLTKSLWKNVPLRWHLPCICITLHLGYDTGLMHVWWGQSSQSTLLFLKSSDASKLQQPKIFG